MPGGCRLWAVPSYLCPSPSLPHPSPHPQPLFVHIWWQKLCRPAALAFCHSGMLRWPTAQKVPHCECSFWKWVFVCVLFKVDLREDKYRMWLLLYPLLNLSISNLIVTLTYSPGSFGRLLFSECKTQYKHCCVCFNWSQMKMLIDLCNTKIIAAL